METRIETTTITTIESAETDNATYELNVTRVNGAVTKVITAVIVQTTATDASGVAVVSARNAGNIIYSGGNISLSGMSADSLLPLYLADVLELIESIKQREE